MTLNIKYIYAAFMLLAMPFFAEHCAAQNVNPCFYVETEDGEEENTSYSGSAPVKVRFEARPEDLDGYNVNYEWRFFEEGATEAYIIRYEENTEFTFTTSGRHKIVLHAFYDENGETIELSNEEQPLTITVSESQLEFPNAFSPNGDGINDTFRAKQGAKSIVEFHAVIVNRWGQVVFKFRDINDEWDGTYNGKPVKDGVYFLDVNAKGADGRTFRIRRDVNVLRGYTEKEINS